MTFEDAISFLYDLRRFGSKLGLENPRRLAALAGNPQHQLRVLHVAGTNGKGSVCAMLESIYRAAGRKVGLFTSPHLVRFTERIQINRNEIAPHEVVRLLEWMQPRLRRFAGGSHPTFFEVVTLMALRHFAEQRCDLVVLETGLGGRLDATNIVDPVASVITNVAMDHQPWLGNTLEAIAREKAGIIKSGRPVFTAADPPALGVIEAKARERHAPLYRVEKARTESAPGLVLPLKGAHQRLNAALAVKTVRQLSDLLPVSPACLRHGLASVEWPGRMETVMMEDHRFILDGAHNEAGARALTAYLRDEIGPRRVSLILGLLEDKDWPPICRALAPITNRVVATRLSSGRSLDPERVAAFFRRMSPQLELHIAEDVRTALQRMAQAPIIVITGSLYLVGEARSILRPHRGLATREPQLNDWTLPAVKPGRG